MSRIFSRDSSFERGFLASTAWGEQLQPIVADVAAAAKRNTRSRGVARGIAAQVGEIGGRMVGRVAGTDMKTGWFEFGTSKIPQERALGRALEEVVGPVEQGRDHA